MRYGVHLLPEDPWPVARGKWRRVEEMGFDHAWTYDHLNWRGFQRSAWFTAVPTLTAAALTTQSITIGALVFSPSIHEPVSLVKDVLTIDDMAGGRLVLGVGSGADGFDSQMTTRTPWTRAERSARFEEYVELTRRLLSSPCTDYSGTHYVAQQVWTLPPTPQDGLPLAVAAAGPRGMRLAARHGQWWVTTGAPNHFERTHFASTVPTVRDQVTRLEEACAAEGRDPTTIRRLLVAGPTVGDVLASADAFFDAAGAFAEVGITDLVVQWPRSDEPYRGEEAVLDRIASRFPDPRQRG